jgi:hypothetical protein
MMNNKLGFYTVNENAYKSKLEALVNASKTKSDIKWNFNNEVFDNQDWTLEPEVDINTLYKLRAQQIRDEYDYVIVMCSGGADSTNVIYSFLKNGIHIDEIIAGAPLSGLKNWKWDDKNINPENLISETKYAQLPLLDEIRNNWPEVKITLHDYFEDMINYKTDEWLYQASMWFNASNSRHTLEKFDHIKNLAESGKKIAKVYGIDKPILYRSQSGNLYSVIIDVSIQTAVHQSTKIDYPNLEPVLFYFTPDMPQILVKQSHILAKWTYMPQNSHIKNLMWNANMTIEQRSSSIRISNYQRLVAKCIYPYLDGKEVFQALKQLDGFSRLTSDDGWFVKLHGYTYAAQLIESDINNFLKLVDKRFLIPNKESFKLYYNFWKIDHESKFIIHESTNTNLSLDVKTLPG